MKNEIKVGDSVVVSNNVQFLKNLKGVVVQNDDWDGDALMVKLETINKMQSIKKRELTNIGKTEIYIDKTELSETNYSEFMDSLDTEIVKQCPTLVLPGYKHSLIISREQWLLDEHGSTVQSIVDVIKILAD